MVLFRGVSWVEGGVGVAPVRNKSPHLVEPGHWPIGPVPVNRFECWNVVRGRRIGEREGRSPSHSEDEGGR